uniref:NADH dehydrogenase subunit 6 n=1 Tax=Microzonia abyssicola TaxID=217214 RepID=UPI002E78F62B|nr:NADH dehydrogenase subunit 6 [Syringoderma abyssicola]WBP70387.1 NADH dehydrogenase subunit 6 [Syringoderma abyssicola]
MSELYVLSFVLTLFLALGLNVVISQNPVYSILYLVLFFITGSSLLALLGYDFLALIFVLVYVGAIAVLFLFVIMILDIKIVNKPGFGATYLVILASSLFFLPFIYDILVVSLRLQYYACLFCSSLPFYGCLAALNDPIFNYMHDPVFMFIDKELHSCLASLVFHNLKNLENFYMHSDLFFIMFEDCYDRLILLKWYFCEFGFTTTQLKSVAYEVGYIFKVDYDSSVKNLQILYTDFTSVFVLSGGVLLVAMTSCISLTLPSRQEVPERFVKRRFKGGV